MTRTASTTAAAAFVLLLASPLLQRATGLLPSPGLGGVETPPEEVAATLSSWHDATLQPSLDAAFAADLGLRDWMVRTDNELRLRAFGVTKRPVLRCDDDWLIEQAYLPRTALASNPGVAARVLLACYDARRLQDALAREGIALAICISPSKVWCYRDRLSPRLQAVCAAVERAPTYVAIARATAAEAGTNLIDLGERFRAWRASDPPAAPALFPRAGIHWSNHGAARAAVLLLHEVERFAGIDVADLELTGAQWSPEPTGNEGDLAGLANVLDTSRWALPSAQPVLRRAPDDRGAPTSVLLVGSSFLWSLASALAVADVAPLSVWFYFRTGFDYTAGVRGAGAPLDAAPEALRAAIRRYRVVVLEANEGTMYGVGDGFVPAALRAFGLEPSQTAPPELAARIAARLRGEH